MNYAELNQIAHQFVSGELTSVDFLNKLQVNDTVRGYLEAASALPDAVKRCIDIGVLLTPRAGDPGALSSSQLRGKVAFSKGETTYFGVLRKFIIDNDDFPEVGDDDDDDHDEREQKSTARPDWYTPVIEKCDNTGGYRFIFRSKHWVEALYQAVRDYHSSQELGAIHRGVVTHGFYISIPTSMLQEHRIFPPDSLVMLTQSLPKTPMSYERRLQKWIDASETYNDIEPDVDRPAWLAPSIKKITRRGGGLRTTFTFKSKKWRDAFYAALERALNRDRAQLKTCSSGTTFNRYYLTVPHLILEKWGMVPLKDEAGAQ